MKRGVFLIIGAVVFIVVIILIVVLNRNGGNAPTKEKITVWTPFNETAVYDKILEGYRQDKPNVTVEVRYIAAKDAKEYEAKVVNEVAEGRGPDIWLLRSDWIPKHTNKLYSVEKTKDSDPIAYQKEYVIPNLVDLGVLDGKLYAVPAYGDSLALIHNVDFYRTIKNRDPNKWDELGLSRPTLTWQELQAEVAKLSQLAGRPVQNIGLGSLGTYAATDVMLAMLVQKSNTIFNAQRDAVTFNLADYSTGQPVFPAREALDLFTSFARPGAFGYNGSDRTTDSYQQFLKGEIGSIIGYYTAYTQLMKDNKNLELAVAPLPQMSAEVPRVDYGVAWMYGVNKSSNAIDTAWYLASEILTSVKAYEIYSKETGKLSAEKSSSSALEASELGTETSSVSRIFTSQLHTSRQYYKPEWQQFDEIIQDMIRQATTPGQSLQNAVDSAAERMKQFLTF